MSEEKAGLKARLLAETKTYLLICAYLALFLAAFTNYRRLVLREYQVGYVEYGFSVIEALILGKLIIIGRALRVGERFAHRPLIIPTLYKTLCFGVLVVIFTMLEHTVVGLWHRESAGVIVERMFSLGKWEILARVLMMVTALAPLFATWEVARCMEEGWLFRLFFKRREQPTPAPPQC
jgi:hypothetical protein